MKPGDLIVSRYNFPYALYFVRGESLFLRRGQFGLVIDGSLYDPVEKLTYYKIFCPEGIGHILESDVIKYEIGS
jgi:hypothetical protein